MSSPRHLGALQVSEDDLVHPALVEVPHQQPLVVVRGRRVVEAGQVGLRGRLVQREPAVVLDEALHRNRHVDQLADGAEGGERALQEERARAEEVIRAAVAASVAALVGWSWQGVRDAVQGDDPLAGLCEKGSLLHGHSCT